MSDRITVEQLVRIRIPRHELLIELTLEEANELFLGLQGVHRGILALRPLRLPMPTRIPIVPTDEGLDLLAADLGITGPTLQDDIENMIAANSKSGEELRLHSLSLRVAGLTESILTTPDYWDCECDERYIHFHQAESCPRCGAHRDSQPDSRVLEVLKHGPEGAAWKFIASDGMQIPGELVNEHLQKYVESIRDPFDTVENPDDADEQEQEFLSRLPQPEARGEKPDSRPAGDLHGSIVEADTPHASDDKQTKRLLEAWHHFRAKYPKRLHPDSYVVGKVATRLTMPSADVRRLLREQGISVDEPMSRAESQRLGEQAKRAKVTPPEPKPVKSANMLLDRFPTPPANLDILDALALTWEILDEMHPQISSFVTARVGLNATMAYKAVVEAFKPEYEALPPFAQREFKSAIAARWHKECAA